MTTARIQTLADQVYSFVFALLDGEPDLDSMESSRIATEIEREFVWLCVGCPDFLSYREMLERLERKVHHGCADANCPECDGERDR